MKIGSNNGIKRIIALMLGLIMVFSMGNVLSEGQLDSVPADERGDFVINVIRPDIIIMDEQSHTTDSSAQIGTDVIMTVADSQRRHGEDPAQVIFHVHDEQGRPIEGAEIYLTLDGETTLIGITDENGLCTADVFLDTTYSYHVQKTGYESAGGTFTVNQQTTDVYVTLRQRYRLEIHVVDGDTPVGGVTVIIDGVPHVTDADGVADAMLPNGEYYVEVIVPGTNVHIPVHVVVEGDTVVWVDISTKENTSFLVYDRDYDPRDYTLTDFLFSPEDLARNEGETDEQYAARQKEYETNYLSTIAIHAEKEETDSLRVKGVEYNDEEYIHTRRSLMPTGAIQRKWMMQQNTRVTFTDGNAILSYLLPETITGDMAKVFGVIDTLEQKDGLNYVKDIVYDTAKTDGYAARNGLVKTGSSLNTEELNLDVVKNFEFESVHQGLLKLDPDHKDDDCIILPDSLYDNALFEYRVTPINREALRLAITAGVDEAAAEDLTAIYLESERSEAQREQMWAAYGYLTKEEFAEIKKIMLDDTLSEEEIGELRQLNHEGKLSDEMLDAIIDYTFISQPFRTSVWLYCEGMECDVTRFLPSFAAAYNVNELIEYAEEQDKQQNPEITDHDLLHQAEEEIMAAVEFENVNDRNIHMDESQYVPGVNTKESPISIRSTAKDEDDEYVSAISQKSYDRITVKISKVNPESPTHKHYSRFTSEETYDSVPLPEMVVAYVRDNNTGIHALHLAKSTAEQLRSQMK